MNLLIIDDDAICNFINVKVARTSGIFKNIHSTYNGREALDFLDNVASGKAPVPDVILLDLNMPLVDGFDFITLLRQRATVNGEGIAIVILTSSELPSDKERAQSLGVAHYLKKPLTLNTLHKTITALKKSHSSLAR